MKKWICLFFLCVLIFLNSCGSGSRDAFLYIPDGDYATEGFIDDNTFQVIGQGAWGEEFVNSRSIEKSREAKQNARLDAQQKAIKLLKEFSLNSLRAGNPDVELNDSTISKIEEYSKKGEIVKTTFDEENNHTVVYRIQIDSLKSMAKKGFE